MESTQELPIVSSACLLKSISHATDGVPRRETIKKVLELPPNTVLEYKTNNGERLEDFRASLAHSSPS